MKLRITILKHHSWNLRQISLQIMLLPIRNRIQVIKQTLSWSSSKGKKKYDNSGKQTDKQTKKQQQQQTWGHT